MRFIKGLIIGSLLGFAVGSSINERQRAELKARLNKQTQSVRQAAGANVSKVADAVTDEAAAVIDDAGDKAADAVDGAVSEPSAP